MCNGVPHATDAAKGKCADAVQKDAPGVLQELGEAVRVHACIDAGICPAPKRRSAPA